MSVSVAQAEQAVEDLVNKVAELGELPGTIRTKFSSVASMTVVRLAGLEDEVREAGEKFADLVSGLWEKLKELFEGLSAPGDFISASFDWEDFQTEVNTMASALEATAVKVDGYWQGSAATAYGTAVGAQQKAVARVGTIINAIRTACMTVGGVGVAFLTALLGIAIAVIVEATLEVAAASSGIGALPAAIAGCFTAAKAAALVTALVAGTSATLVAVATQIQALNVELGNNQAFPDGHWPASDSSKYNDATVKDGDADWSVKTA
ncbi:hypothetical protein [Nocardia sp. XZ_19_385]|uniref:hypothetical protein n=1 Tax=Nocardia sp. XZ_19_385 TaxID=2769488 RepID=UPI00188F8FEE|nr:hypothetical protein [Nocardia sp. XZ_19_385]